MPPNNRYGGMGQWVQLEAEIHLTEQAGHGFLVSQLSWLLARGSARCSLVWLCTGGHLFITVRIKREWVKQVTKLGKIQLKRIQQLNPANSSYLIDLEWFALPLWDLITADQGHCLCWLAWVDLLYFVRVDLGEWCYSVRQNLSWFWVNALIRLRRVYGVIPYCLSIDPRCWCSSPFRIDAYFL